MNDPKTMDADANTVPAPPQSVIRKHDDGIRNIEAGNDNQVQPPAAPQILYHAKCVESDNLVKVFYSEKPFVGLNLHGFDDEKPTPLIEVEFTVKGKVSSQRQTDE